MCLYHNVFVLLEQGEDSMIHCGGFFHSSSIQRNRTIEF